jgi:hypothetical protein
MHEITPDAIVQMLRDLPNIERLWESEKKDLNFVTLLRRRFGFMEERYPGSDQVRPSLS